MTDQLQPPCVGLDELPWPQTFDANAWAIEFCKRFGTESIDEALMIGWFANAIMCGFDRQSPEIQRLQAENASLWALAKLGRWAIETGRYDLEGGEIQYKALELGLLYEVMATESCGGECNCAELGEWPISCLRMTDKAKVLDVDP